MEWVTPEAVGGGYDGEFDVAVPDSRMKHMASKNRPRRAAETPSPLPPSTGSTMRDAAGSWLTGPYQAPGAFEYRGEDLGLPEAGPGSIAGGWLRVLALLIDWFLAMAIAFLFVGPKEEVVVNGHVFSAFEVTAQAMAIPQFIIWFVVGLVAVALFGFTPGQFVAGTRVARVDLGPERGAAEAAGTEPRAAVGVIRSLVRQLLIPFVVPALINDYNGRAMHDRATGTAVLRTR